MENQIDEISPEDKYTHLPDLFLKGDDIQKLSIIQALPQLVRIDQHATFSRIVPKIQQELPKASSEFQVTTSQIFRVLIEKELPVNLLGAVIQGVDSRDPVVSAAWMDTLLSVIPTLSESVIKNEIIPLISIKSQLTQPVIQRVAGCRIIGKIAIHKALKASDIKKDILPYVHSLSQDCSVEVRAVMCMQLPAVAEGMGIGIVKTQLLPCFVELASDNTPLVREAAVLTLVNLFPYIEKDLIENTIIPLIKKLCEKCIPEDNIASIIASQYGAILDHITPYLSNDDKAWFLSYYRILARTGFETRPGGMQTVDASKDVVCRENCASNLPEVAKFVNTSIPQQMDVLYSIFRDLAGDPCYIVRRAVAGCIHNIAVILGPQNRMLKTDFVRLLRDDAEDVLQMLVPNLKATLTLLAQFGFLSKDRTDQTTMEISRAVLKCQIELAKGYNWRLLATFLEQLECLPICMPCDFIHQHFTPIILGNAANGRVKPVRYQAIKTLLIFLRYNKKDNQQKWLRESLINQFCYSDSCYTRQIYVKLCHFALDIFSSRYFKEFFFQPLLCLAEDPVSNVRYSFIGILPNLKLLTLLPPMDTKYKVILQDAITKLETKEKEKYVVQHLRNTLRDVQLVSLIGNKEFQQRDMAKQEQEAAFNNPTPEKQIATITAHQTMKPKIGSGGGGITSGRPGRRTSVTRLGTPSKTTSSSLSSTPSSIDINFLTHHFYTDAGVNLPATDTTTKMPRRTTNINDDDDNMRRLIETNMTDDVKVNLRRRTLNKNSTYQHQHHDRNSVEISFRNKSVKMKRHSSVLFACTATDKTRANNNNRRDTERRRSLNINSHHQLQQHPNGRESSRIPICIKKRDSLVVGGNSAVAINCVDPVITTVLPTDRDSERNIDEKECVAAISSININSCNNSASSSCSSNSSSGEPTVYQCSNNNTTTRTMSNLPIAVRKPNK